MIGKSEPDVGFIVYYVYFIWFTQHCNLTLRGRDKMAAILLMIFSNAFSGMNMFEFRIKFHWSLFVTVQITLGYHWFREWLGTERQAIIWGNGGLGYWFIYMYASLCLNDNKCAYNSHSRKSMVSHWHGVFLMTVRVGEGISSQIIRHEY